MSLLRHVMMKKGAIAVSTAYFIVFLTFLTAYANPSKSVKVTVDDYNEANIELGLMVLTLPAALRFLVGELKVVPVDEVGVPHVANARAQGSGTGKFLMGDYLDAQSYTESSPVFAES